MAMGIFEQLSWLTTKVKRLCCAVDTIKESGAGSYKVYTGLLSQVGIADPTAIVLENTLGQNITFTYKGVGEYASNTYDPSGTGDFTANSEKIVIFTGTQSKNALTNGIITFAYYEPLIGQIVINTEKSGTLNDQILYKTPIEIRYYN